MKHSNFAGRLLIVYQMPKTGSQTVESTLHHCSLPHRIVRCHFLGSAIARSMSKALRNEQVPEQCRRHTREQLRVMTEMSRLLRVRKLLRFCRVNVPKIEIITAVREPIGLALSSIFENFFEQFADLGPAALDYCQEMLLRPKMLKYVRDWFDLELKPITGIDVYESPFPSDQGYNIYENRFARALVYRFEALDQLGAMLQEFLGCAVPQLISRNRGYSKEYASLYQQAKEQLRLPAPFVAAQCAGKMMRHFYSLAEREGIYQRWARCPYQPVPIECQAA